MDSHKSDTFVVVRDTHEVCRVVTDVPTWSVSGNGRIDIEIRYGSLTNVNRQPSIVRSDLTIRNVQISL